MIDVDHFKHYNDTHSHTARDEALRTIARIMAENIRAQDIVYRYAGEELSGLLPGAGAGEPLSVAERVHSTGRRGDRVRRCCHCEYPNPNTLKQLTDQALYGAKEQGRNRVVLV